MTRQYIRLSEVRPPDVIDDTQSTEQLALNSQTAPDAEAFLQTVLSQIRILTGQSSWTDPPKADISAIVTTQTQQNTVIDQIQPALAQSTAISQDQAAAIAALQDSAQAGQSQLDTLNATLTALEQVVESQAALAASQQQLSDLRDNLAAQAAAVNASIAALQAQVDAQARLDQDLEEQVSQLQAQNAKALAQTPLLDQPVVGPQDGVNLTFMTQTPFVPGSLKLLYNGVRLRPGDGNDFVVSQGAAAVGYQQITIIPSDLAPRPADTLTVDFTPAI